MSESDSRTKTEDASGDENETIAKDIVVTKYNMAADIVNSVLKDIVAKCKPDQSVMELCDFGDQQLTEKTGKVFKKDKEMKKGIAFPTCISINHCVCHFSPLRSEADTKLAVGDVVKVDLGAHVDGFIAVGAHTVIIGATAENKVTGRKADALLAAHYALEAAIRMLKPGVHKNMDVTDTIQKIAESYKCKPIENMLSHQISRNKIDGEKQIIQNPGEKQRQDLEKCEFEQYEVYAIDILMSTGEGKAREMDNRTTIYKKNEELVYQLKMKASRAFFSDADKRFGVMPFTLRAFEEEKKVKMGVVECERHSLMKPFPVLFEREGEFVVQFKATVLILPTGLLKVTGLSFDENLYSSECKLEDPKLLQIIQASLKTANKKKSKKKGEQARNEISAALTEVAAGGEKNGPSS